MAPLPFSCRMAGAAAQADTETLPSPEPKDGKYEVLFPVGYPDEGASAPSALAGAGILPSGSVRIRGVWVPRGTAEEVEGILALRCVGPGRAAAQGPWSGRWGASTRGGRV